MSERLDEERAGASTPYHVVNDGGDEGGALRPRREPGAEVAHFHEVVDRLGHVSRVDRYRRRSRECEKVTERLR